MSNTYKADSNIMDTYEDIIDLPHYEPRHRRMPLENRAAQFAPFAALTGHSDAIAETARHNERLRDNWKHNSGR